jgi:hypothetical protein
MPKFRKKPVEIEAIQFNGANQDEVVAFTDYQAFAADCEMFIDTLEGTMEAAEGDWIIRGIKGEFYPCKPDIFEATYEKVVEDG